MKSRVISSVCGVGLAAVALSSGATAAPAPPSDTSGTFKDAAASFVAKDRGISTTAARAVISTQERQRKTLRTVERTVTADGSYFKGDKLVVVVTSQKAAAKVRSAGLSARVGGGESTLGKRADALVADLGKRSTHIQSIEPDVTTGTLNVTVTDSAPSSVITQIKSTTDGTVKRGDDLSTYADVIPGQAMRFDPNDPNKYCSLGFPGRLAGGHTVLLTAGHCVLAKYPNVYNAAGTKLGYTFATRFTEGRASVDMGIMDIDNEDTGQPYVDTRAGVTLPVRGMQKAPINAAVCKAGNTSGWTCGNVKSYNNRVTYTNQAGVRTPVSGLARTTVCSAPGDSGGAYIWGDQAQGMTSGGPTTQRCAFNGGNIKNSTSYVQPVWDAAKNYGVTLETQ
ncbi:S1 family peptidase [Demetria terragena]|uniref:S1 family peptidase n=1 Tax=Demetria terragena TaxID=63959 RepID=UPI0003805D95|nr:S1 family peptidase [Demetria terragena]